MASYHKPQPTTEKYYKIQYIRYWSIDNCVQIQARGLAHFYYSLCPQQVLKILENCKTCINHYKFTIIALHFLQLLFKAAFTFKKVIFKVCILFQTRRAGSPLHNQAVFTQFFLPEVSSNTTILSAGHIGPELVLATFKSILPIQS